MATTPSPDWRHVLKRRIGVATAGLALWTVAIEGRLIHLQVVQHAELSSRAERQQNRTVTAFAKRGEIRDRNGNLLAFSVDADTVYAVPTEIERPSNITAALCAVFRDCSPSERKALLERLSSRKAFVYVRRQISPADAQQIAALQLEGIGFMKESRRYYPKRELASHVLGYVGLDNIGLGGLESTYDKLIKGEPGTVVISTDAKRRPFSSVTKPPAPGATLELTLDQQLQYIVERELEAGVRENGAEGGAAVMMDPWSGEILAMANWPTFNPNDYRNSREEQRRNRTIQDIYEPGSTFKVVTASAALEQHVVTPDQYIDATGGKIKLAGSRIVRDTHDYGVLTFTDVIVKSSNVGAIRVGLRLGPERLSDYVRKFGFGRQSSPDFPAESAGIVWDPSKLNDSALASVSMGYQVSVTPLQMAAAVSSIANGGELVQPRVVRAVIRDNVRTPVPRKIMNLTIKDKKVIAELTAIMEKVVEDGTAKAAKIDGFTIAGKTGTAAQLVNGRYSANLWNASFVGFVPSRKPEFTLIVMIDAPHTKGHTGGAAAAPVFKRIAEAALRHTGVPRSINPPTPILAGRKETERPAVPTAVVMTPVSTASPAFLPDLRGKSAREALQTLSSLGLEVRMAGSGWVVRQEPPAGTRLDDIATSSIWLDREPLLTPSSTQ